MLSWVSFRKRIAVSDFQFALVSVRKWGDARAILRREKDSNILRRAFHSVYRWLNC